MEGLEDESMEVDAMGGGDSDFDVDGQLKKGNRKAGAKKPKRQQQPSDW